MFKKMAVMLPAFCSSLLLTVQAAPIKEEELDALVYGLYITGGTLAYLAIGKLWNWLKNRNKSE